MPTKICKCQTHSKENPLDISSFSKDKNQKDGYTPWCKECVSLYQKQYRKKNSDIILEKVKKYAKENPNVNREASRRYRENNQEKRKESTRKWRQANKGMVTFFTNMRHKRMKVATPTWIDRDAIKAIYIQAGNLMDETGTKYHVHHIIPIQENPNICGLNVPWNLIILTEEEHKAIHRSF